MDRQGVRLGWATDVHWDHASTEARERFGAECRAGALDHLVLTGDVSVATRFCRHIRELVSLVGCPVSFVLGNHDYYGGSWASVDAQVSGWARGHATWLRAEDVVLTPEAVLVGTEGWADGRYADWMRSSVELADFQYISELGRTPVARRDETNWKRVLGRQQEYADRQAQALWERCTRLAERYRAIYVATHVPPFPENAMYAGRVSDAQWLPHFTCRAVGDALLSLADQHPHVAWTVLCGHSHHRAVHQPRSNLLVATGSAEYRAPRLAATLHVLT